MHFFLLSFFTLNLWLAMISRDMSFAARKSRQTGSSFSEFSAILKSVFKMDELFCITAQQVFVRYPLPLTERVQAVPVFSLQ